MMRIQPEDIADLKAAKWLLENPGIAAKITDLLGTPIQRGFELLPRALERDDWRGNPSGFIHVRECRGFHDGHPAKKGIFKSLA